MEKNKNIVHLIVFLIIIDLLFFAAYIYNDNLSLNLSEMLPIMEMEIENESEMEMENESEMEMEIIPENEEKNISTNQIIPYIIISIAFLILIIWIGYIIRKYYKEK